MSHKGRTVDEYVSSFPAPVQDILHDLRRTIRTALPAKDTMRLPLREPIPHDLLGRLVTALAKERAHRDC